MKETYVINYNNNSHMSLELDPVASSLLQSEMVKGTPVVFLAGVGTFRLTDVWSIVLQHPTEETPENPSYNPDMTDAEREYIKQQEWLEKYYRENPSSDEEADDADYPAGGMLP